MSLKSLTRKLVIFSHSKENKNVHICFADFRDEKIVGQEEAILEEPELYEALKHLLVKFKK